LPLAWPTSTSEGARFARDDNRDRDRERDREREWDGWVYVPSRRDVLLVDDFPAEEDITRLKLLV